MQPIEIVSEVYNPKGWTDSDLLAGENPEQLGFQFSTDEAYSVFNQDVRPKMTYGHAVMATLPKIIIGYGIRYNPTYKLMTQQIIYGYRLNKKWSIQGQYSNSHFSKMFTLSEIGLGVEYRKNLNNAGYPLFLGTSVWISHSNIYKKHFDERIREQAIAPRLSLSKRTSKFFTFELFVNYPLTIHSNTDINNNRFPQIGMNCYLY